VKGGEEILNTDPNRRDGMDTRAEEEEDRGVAKGEVVSLPGGEGRELGRGEGDKVSCAVEERGEETGFMRDCQKRVRGRGGSGRGAQDWGKEGGKTRLSHGGA